MSQEMINQVVLVVVTIQTPVAILPEEIRLNYNLVSVLERNVIPSTWMI